MAVVVFLAKNVRGRQKFSGKSGDNVATIQRITRVLRKIEIVQFVQIDCASNHHKRILAAPRQKSHCACSAVQKRSLWELILHFLAKNVRGRQKFSGKSG